MTNNEHSHKLTFEMEKTSRGYIAQGIEIPEIIIEAATKKKIIKYLYSATECYLESFPEEHEKLLGVRE